MKTRASIRHTRNPARRQQGVIMIIALIVLVSMTLAAIGMSRSIDTVNMVAGNLGFKQASLNAADKGIEAGFQWLLAGAGTATLNNTDTSAGFYSSQPLSENWSNEDSWADEVVLDGGAADASGNRVSYVIHRMCTLSDMAYNGPNNQCATSLPSGGSTTGGSMAVGAIVFEGNPQIYYRITARSQGPRNTLSVVQSMIAVTN